MDGTQVLAQHPDGGIEPLKGGEKVDEDHVPRMTQADVSPFMSENSGILLLVVVTVHHYVVHPAERSQRCVTGHAEGDTIFQRMLLASSYQHDDFPYRSRDMAQHSQHSYYI